MKRSFLVHSVINAALLIFVTTLSCIDAHALGEHAYIQWTRRILHPNVIPSVISSPNGRFSNVQHSVIDMKTGEYITNDFATIGANFTFSPNSRYFLFEGRYDNCGQLMLLRGVYDLQLRTLMHYYDDVAGGVNPPSQDYAFRSDSRYLLFKTYRDSRWMLDSFSLDDSFDERVRAVCTMFSAADVIVGPHDPPQFRNNATEFFSTWKYGNTLYYDVFRCSDGHRTQHKVLVDSSRHMSIGDYQCDKNGNTCVVTLYESNNDNTAQTFILDIQNSTRKEVDAGMSADSYALSADGLQLWSTNAQYITVRSTSDLTYIKGMQVPNVGFGQKLSLRLSAESQRFLAFERGTLHVCDAGTMKEIYREAGCDEYNCYNSSLSHVVKQQYDTQLGSSYAIISSLINGDSLYRVDGLASGENVIAFIGGSEYALLTNRNNEYSHGALIANWDIGDGSSASRVQCADHSRRGVRVGSYSYTLFDLPLVDSDVPDLQETVQPVLYVVGDYVNILPARECSIYNSIGELVLHQSTEDGSVNLGALSSGFYLIGFDIKNRDTLTALSIIR